MKIICISDTHNLHAQMSHPVPNGDILIHAGDISNNGDLEDIISFAEWSKNLKHKYKIIIAGNHDFCFDPNGRIKKYTPLAQKTLKEAGWIYLEDSSCIIEGIKFYGSPWQPTFFDWAFNAERGKEIAKIWELIPEDTDVLITHGPPAKILDKTHDGSDVGCEDLLKKIQDLKIKLHVFGHIHEAYGSKSIEGTVYANACICNLDYSAVNLAIVVDL